VDRGSESPFTHQRERERERERGSGGASHSHASSSTLTLHPSSSSHTLTTLGRERKAAVVVARTVKPLDPRVIQLRSLAHKLRLLFPEDAGELGVLLDRDFGVRRGGGGSVRRRRRSGDGGGEDDVVGEHGDDGEEEMAFVDPRGPEPKEGDSLIHVFIDQCVPSPSPLHPCIH